MGAKRGRPPKRQRVTAHLDDAAREMVEAAIPELAATGRGVLPDVIAEQMAAIQRSGGLWPVPTADTEDVQTATLAVFQAVGRVVALEYTKATGADPDAVTECMNSTGLVYVGLDANGMPDGPPIGFGFGTSRPGPTTHEAYNAPALRPVMDALRWMRATKGRAWCDVFGLYVIGAMWSVAKEGRERRNPYIGDRTLLPRRFLNVFKTGPAQLAQQGDRIGQGELFPMSPEVLETLQAARGQVTTRQLMRLSASEIRALHAAFRCVSAYGDDGKQFARTEVTLPWAAFCSAAGIDRKQTNTQRDLVTAARALDRRDVYASMETPDPDNPGKRMLMIASTKVARVGVVWNNLSPEASARAFAEYEALAPGETWSGPLPTLVTITVPPGLTDTVGALALDGSVVKRLDDGSRAVRGTMHRLNPLDHALFLELTQRVQSQQVAALDNGGPSLWSYVYRDAFLADFYGPDAIARAKQQRNYRKLETSYHQAVKALEAGGLVLKSELDYQGRKGDEKGGVQDRFALNPELVKGLGERALRRTPDPEQPALPAGASSTPARRGRGRPRKSGG